MHYKCIKGLNIVKRQYLYATIILPAFVLKLLTVDLLKSEWGGTPLREVGGGATSKINFAVNCHLRTSKVCVSKLTHLISLCSLLGSYITCGFATYRVTNLCSRLQKPSFFYKNKYLLSAENHMRQQLIGTSGTLRLVCYSRNPEGQPYWNLLKKCSMW